MEDVIDFDEDNIKLSERELYTKIWTSPRRVLKYINESKYDRHTIPLLVLSGVARSLDRAATQNAGDQMSLWGILTLNIIVGAVFGWILNYFYAGLISWTGNWLKGQSDTKSILRVMSFALIPSALSLLFLIPQIAIYGNEIFKKDGDFSTAGTFVNYLVVALGVVMIILNLWTLVLTVIAVSEAQNFSIGKSIANILLPIVIIFVPILLIVLLFKSF